jgi:hypothetical protein
MKGDPAFQLYLKKRSGQLAAQVEAELLPTGSYREDGIIPLANEMRVRMPYATRDEFIEWSAIEKGEANLRYIATRLAAWDITKGSKVLGNVYITQDYSF